MNVIDLFAGPGGWDVGAAELGLDPLGIELDDAACETREAAGLRTRKGDVSIIDPRSVDPAIADDGCDLLIASPPCQAWSMAGSRQGEHDREAVYAVARRWGKDPGDDWADPRSPLAAEPMRWVDALMPAYIAFEQVPPVIDLWRLCASLLAERGYAVWTGILSAERYGVPQTRKRAILMAARDGGVHPPMPTHLPYVAGEPKPTEPMLTLEGELLPWVSMAEALGWGMTARRVGFPRRNDLDTEGEYRERDFRGEDEPAFALTEKARSVVKMPALKAGTNENDATRAADEPAPTMRFGDRLNTVAWREAADSRPAPTLAPGKTGDGREPAPTIAAGHSTDSRVWVNDRPATTVLNDSRIARPGHKGTADEGDKYGGPQMRDAVRVTVEEASLLQSFPADYPWQGSRTKQFQQIGNAVPPLMAKAILEALIA